MLDPLYFSLRNLPLNSFADFRQQRFGYPSRLHILRMPFIMVCKVTAHLSGLSVLDRTWKASEFNGFLSDQAKDTFLDHFSDLGCLFALKTKIVPTSCTD